MDEEISLYTSPWVTGTRAAAYFGPVSTQLFVADTDPDARALTWQAAERDLLERLRARIRELGGNSGVGLEITIDPFAVLEAEAGILLHAACTAAELAPLF